MAGFGGSVKLTGADQYKSALKDITQNLKVMSAEMKATSSSFEAGEKIVKLHAVISAQEPTLNPSLLEDALKQKAPEIAPDFAKFTRLETYHENMEIYR